MEVEEDVTIGEVAKKRGRGRPRKYKPREPVEEEFDEEDYLEQKSSSKENPAGSHSNSPSWREYWESFYNEKDEVEKQRKESFHSKGKEKTSVNPWLYKGLGLTALTGLYYYMQTSGIGGNIASTQQAQPVQESLTEAVKEAVTAPVEAVKEVANKVADTVVNSDVDSQPKPVSAWNKAPKKSNRW